MIPRERFHHAPREGDSWCECPDCGSTNIDLLIGALGDDGIHPRQVKFECRDCERDSPAESTLREKFNSSNTERAIDRHIDETLGSPAPMFEPTPEERGQE